MIRTLWGWLGFHVHDWGLWEEYSFIQTPKINGLPVISLQGEVLGQKRVCKSCGKIQVEGL